MCGICGIAWTGESARADRRVLIAMRDAMSHRGPDGFGEHVSAGVALGHRRLSIVDVEHGQQPMYSADNRCVIVYNGEIFNHPSLKSELEMAGVHYRTRSDTETLLHLYDRHGEQAVTHCRGMFAFAVWDITKRTLLLGRDRFGVKPLYYRLQDDGTLYFASEIKCLAVATPGLKLNTAALPDYLANHATSDDGTLYQGVHRLPPGHTLTWRDGKITLRKYWDLADAYDRGQTVDRPLDDRKVVAEFTSRFTEAVRLRLMSDVPLGMFLSGGIDSAAITATMATLVQDPIKTFSVAFAEREANEFQYARLVANAYRTDHHEVVVSAEQFFNALPKLIWHEDEPLAHPSSVPLYFVSLLAAQHVKVVLTGEGSDEMLAGYNRYRVTDYNVQLGSLYRQFAPRFLRNAVSSVILKRPKTSRTGAQLARTFLARAPDLDSLYFDNFAVFDRGALRALLTDNVLASIPDYDPYVAFHAARGRVAPLPLVSQLLYTDSRTYLHELLMKQDQMSMAASIESRVPFLDHPLTEWVAALPQRMKLRGRTTKWVLREAMRGRLPDAILTRKKMGFPVPIGTWLRGPWRHLLDRYVLDERIYDRQLFQPEALQQLVSEHLQGVNHSERLWSLLNFEIWARQALDGDPVPRMDA